MTEPAAYRAWKAQRLAALSAEDGWLNLTDRVEIPQGPCRVGAASDNDLILSRGPAHLGQLLPGFTFALPGQDARPFDAAGGNPMLRVGDFLLEIHSVNGQPALRVRDLTLPRQIDLRYYPYDPDWRITAEWQALRQPVGLRIDQKGAGPTDISLTHQAHFVRAGQAVTVLATHWKDGQPMFVIRDQTSGQGTYAAARFLIGQDVGATTLTLDFNQAHTPPCGFTDFAICPLPPAQNILPFRIEAGELAP